MDRFRIRQVFQLSNRSHRRNAIVPLVGTSDDFPGFSNSYDTDHGLGNADRSSTPTMSTTKVRTLMDISAAVVAKWFPCEYLESRNLEEMLLKKVAYWAFPQDERTIQAFANLTDKYNEWNKGVLDVEEKNVNEMYQVGFMAAASIFSSQSCASNVKVTLVFEQQRIVSSKCSHCKKQIWCSHVIAAVLYRIRFPEKVPVYAPMTESLSTLNRDQLQKLLQYAVQEDPGGMLGLVFGYLDTIRDSTSDINKLAGAPDPTFGIPQDMCTQWELSVKDLKNDLDEKFERLISLRYMGTSSITNTMFYPASYDVVQKADSTLFKFVKKAFDLAQQSEMVSAALVLTTITDCAFRAPALNFWRNRNLLQFCHDLEQVFCMLILNPDTRAKDKLIQKAQEINARTDLRECMMEYSPWAEFPPISQAKTAKMTSGDKSSLFYVPLCAGVCEPWSKELLDLLEGKVSIIDSTYDEDVIIMIARFNSLLFTGHGDIFPKVGHLATVILRKLLILNDQYSILSNHRRSKNTGLHELFPSIIPQVHAPSSTEKETKGKSLRKGGRKSKSSKPYKPPAKKQKTSHDVTGGCKSGQGRSAVTDGSAMSKAQLTYAILIICDTLIRVEKLTASLPMNRTFLINCILAGLESSRFRTVAKEPACSLKEHKWLFTLERHLVTYIKTHAEDYSIAYDYVDAMCNDGGWFYEGVYPLVLIDTVLFVLTKNSSPDDKLQDKVMSMCAQILLNNTKQLDVFNLPMSGDGLEDDSEDAFKRVHRDFVRKKFHVIIETFLSKVKTSDNSHLNLLSQVLEKFEDVKDVDLLQLLTRDLRLQLPKLQEANKLESCLRIVVNSIQLSKSQQNIFTEKQDKEILFSLVNSVGVKCIKLFVHSWKSFLRLYELKKLLMMLKPLLEYQALPKEVVSMVMQYYESKDNHDPDACELLSFFKTGDANYTTAVKKILANTSAFHSYALFSLARSHCSESVSSADKKEEKMDDATFQLVDVALASLEKDRWNVINNSKTFEFVDWVCTVCTTGNPKDVVKSSYFTNLLRKVKWYAGDYPCILVQVLQFLERSPLLMKQASILGTTLIAAYKIHFVQSFQQCGHAAYDKVISEMVNARLHSKQYVKGGDAKFDKMVLNGVKEGHAGKKKLMRMLNEAFG